MWIRLACVTAATAMLLLAGSSGAVAQADADSDYLAMLSNYGLNATPDGERLYSAEGFIRIGTGITYWHHLGCTA